MIGAECLCKSYGSHIVLRNVSFQITGFAVLTAPSGAGKTTLLRLLMGLESPDSGQIRIPPRCRWGAVFQEDRLLPGLDAVENLRFVLGRAYDPNRTAALLEELGIAGAGNQSVRSWSGGMKRRLSLARALLAPSDALALDEPFAGLDLENRCLALDAVRRLGAGKPVILVTHDAGDGAYLGAETIAL